MFEPGSEPTSDLAPPSEPSEGGMLTVEQAIANLTHPDLGLRYYAAWWLGKFRVDEPAAVDALILALEDESDRTELGGYPLRRNAARALGKLGDRRAVPGLIQCLACDDFYVREAAAQSLGMLGDTSGIPALLPLLEGGVAAAQRVPGRPHLTQPYEAVVEALGLLAPGTTWADEAIAKIQPFLEHSVQRLQYATSRAMYQLTGETVYGERLVQALRGQDVSLRRVALSDLGAVGYFPAAEAIASAAAENSFKLFSLKGILQRQVTPSDTHPSEQAIQVMTLMDSLL
ncbi:MAG TPA: HEAT repeat domain-containing protein [Crinalium sp.]